VANGFLCAWILREPVYPRQVIDTLGQFQMTAQTEFPPLTQGTLLQPNPEPMTQFDQSLFAEENWRLWWRTTLIDLCAQHAREPECRSSYVRALKASPATLLLLQAEPSRIRYWLAVDRDSHLDLQPFGELSRSELEAECVEFTPDFMGPRPGFDGLLWAGNNVYVDRETLAIVPLCALSVEDTHEYSEEYLIAISPDRRWIVYGERLHNDEIRLRVADVQNRQPYHAYYTLSGEQPLLQSIPREIYETDALSKSFIWTDDGIEAIPSFVLQQRTPIDPP
jgi:hypothetical protein